MRILFVAVAWTPHTARWINQLDGEGWDVHLFPLENHTVHPQLRNVTVHDPVYGRPPGANETVRVVDDFWPILKTDRLLARGYMTARRIEARLYKQRSERAFRLANTVRRLNPDIVHTLTIWPGGDLLAQATKFLDRPLPPWIVNSWGSDIYLFPRLAQYADKIKAVLSACDYFTCDCRRDRATARAHGFRGEFLPVVPVTGGLEVEHIRQFRDAKPPSQRKTVVLKGYQDVPGRALVALRAFELCADLLRGYRIAIFLPSEAVRTAAELLAQRTGLEIEMHPRTADVHIAPHEDVLRLHGSARVSVGLSISDGLPLAVLEAMLLGSLPIQSDTSCAGEWVRDGETALLVPPEDPQAVADALRRALTDDALVDRAAELNAPLVAERLDVSVVRPKVVSMYRRVAARGRPDKSRVIDDETETVEGD